VRPLPRIASRWPAYSPPVQLLPVLTGSVDMNTFLKVCLILLVVAIVAHVCPWALGPVGVFFGLIFAVGSVACGIVGAIASIGFVALLALLLAGLVLLAVSSPLWVPVLLIALLVAAIRGVSRRTA
jgi:hypothetical protein